MPTQYCFSTSKTSDIEKQTATTRENKHENDALSPLATSVSAGFIPVEGLGTLLTRMMHALREGTIASDGARLTYAEVYANGDARDPLPEEYEPTISRGESNREVLVKPYDEDETHNERVFLVKAEDPDRAYQLVGKPCKMLDHHGEGWGQIEIAVVLPRVRSVEDAGVLKFSGPKLEEAEWVAVKKLNKAVVKCFLDHGAHEDPYKEISRMQELGDNIHVLACVEALEDSDYLYIVTPYCREGSLAEGIRWGKGYPEAEAQALFKNILEILFYLERHGIFHHDLAPDNFLFLKGRLVLFDFAMSLRVPRQENGRRYLMPPQGVYGTLPCQPPELFFNKTPFDGIGADLWGASVTLYALLTGQVLYKMPHPTDISFSYFILHGGLRPGLNEKLVEILEEAFQPDRNHDKENLMTIAMANLSLSPDALELLLNLLAFNPANRWTLMQACDSAWVQRNFAKRRIE